MSNKYAWRLETLSIPLPNKSVVPGERWKAQRALPIPTPKRDRLGQVDVTYTYLGRRPLSVTPDTGPERGLVTVTTRKLKVRTLLTLFGSAMGHGEILRRSKNVDYRTDLKRLEICRGFGDPGQRLERAAQGQQPTRAGMALGRA